MDAADVFRRPLRRQEEAPVVSELCTAIEEIPASVFFAALIAATVLIGRLCGK